MPGAKGGAIADRVAEHMAALLGPNTARVAVKVFAQRGLGRGPETLTVHDLPTLTAALRPMLNTLIGRDRSDLVIKRILAEFGL
jgi:hypothetical protein